MVLFRFRNTMRRELLKRTVKLIRIVRHIIVLPREKGISKTTPTGFRVAFKVAHFCTLLGKYEISEIISNECLLLNLAKARKLPMYENTTRMFER